MSIKSILVTGGCGFIGSHFVNYIGKKYPDITLVNVDAMYYCANKSNVNPEIAKKTNYHFYYLNILEIDKMSNIMNKNQVDLVIHFAAQSHVDNSFESSLDFVKDNVMGTNCLLEAIKKTDRKIKLIHISTDEVYGENETSDEHSETTLLYPTNPYAASKAAAEMYVKAYYRSFKIDSIIIRMNNVYGPRQYPEKLIPKFINLLKQNKKMTIHGQGLTKRSYIHVDDVVRAIDLVARQGKIGEIYNIGINEEHTVIEIAQYLLELIKPGQKLSDWVDYVPDRKFNDKRYYLNFNKLLAMSWQPTIDFKTGLKTVV